MAEEITAKSQKRLLTDLFMVNSYFFLLLLRIELYLSVRFSTDAFKKFMVHD